MNSPHRPKTFDQQARLALCAECGREFTRRKPWQRCCSPRCRLANFRAAHAFHGADDDALNGARPQNPKITAVRPGLAGSGGICAPRDVIEAAFGDRTWRPTISADGVPAVVSGGRS
jgi:hypothetical protein